MPPKAGKAAAAGSGQQLLTRFFGGAAAAAAVVVERGGGVGGEGEEQERRPEAEEEQVHEREQLAEPDSAEVDTRHVRRGRDTFPRAEDVRNFGHWSTRLTLPQAMPRRAWNSWMVWNRLFLDELNKEAETVLERHGKERDARLYKDSLDAMCELWLVWEAVAVIPLAGREKGMVKRIQSAYRRVCDAMAGEPNARRAMLVEAKKMIREKSRLPSARAQRREEAGEDDPRTLTRLRRRVMQLVRNGQVGKATKILHAGGAVASFSEDTIERLQKLLPEGPARLEAKTKLGPKEVVTITTHRVMSIPRGEVDNGTAAGPDGITGAFLYPLLQYRETAEPLARMMTILARGYIPDGLLADVLRACRLIPLIKPDGGVRPISISGVVSKLTSKLLMDNVVLSDELTRLFPDLQLGVGAPAGIERGICAMQAEWDQRRANGTNDDVAVALIDCTNAFGSRDKAEMLAVLDRQEQGKIRQLIPYVEFMCREPTAMLVHDGAKLGSILSHTQGCRQGDPISPLVFSLSCQEGFSNIVAAAGEGSRGLGVMDDLSVIAPIDNAMDSIEYMLANPPLGLRMNNRKTVLLIPRHRELTPEQEQRVRELGVHVARGTARLVGGIIGDVYDPEAQEDEEWKKMVEKEEATRKRFMLMMDRLRLPAQVQLQMLKQSWLARDGFLARLTVPSLLEPMAKKRDEEVCAQACRILGLGHMEVFDSPNRRRQLQQPVALGGFGIVSLQETSGSAFLASRLGALALDRQKLWERLRGTRQWEEMEKEWGRMWQGIQEKSKRVAKALVKTLNMPERNAQKRRRPPMPSLEELATKMQKKDELVKMALQAAKKAARSKGSVAVSLGLKAKKDAGVAFTERKVEKIAGWRTKWKEREDKDEVVKKIRAALDRSEEGNFTFLTTRSVLRVIRLQHQFSRTQQDSFVVGRWRELRERVLDTATTPTAPMEERWDEVRAGIEFLRFTALLDTSTGWLWRVVPTSPATTIRDIQLQMAARARIGLPPRIGLVHCPWAQHAKYWPLPANTNVNGAFLLDPSHHAVCKEGLSRKGNATQKHNMISQALQEIAEEAGCATQWEPPVSDLIDSVVRALASGEGEASRALLRGKQRHPLGGEEADLSIDGFHLRRPLLIDVRVQAINTAGHLRYVWGKCSPSGTPDMTIAHTLKHVEADKNKLYAGKARRTLEEQGDPRLAGYDGNHRDGPLYLWDINFVPTVVSDLGNMGASMRRMLKELAVQAAKQELQAMRRMDDDKLQESLIREHQNNIRGRMAVAAANAMYQAFLTYNNPRAQRGGGGGEQGRVPHQEQQEGGQPVEEEDHQGQEYDMRRGGRREWEIRE